MRASRAVSRTSGSRNKPISSEHIKVVVKNGWVTLEGQVEWQYQRSTAETAVRRIKGVKGVSNLIQIKPRAAPAEIKKKIQEAFSATPKSMPTASGVIGVFPAGAPRVTRYSLTISGHVSL